MSILSRSRHWLGDHLPTGVKTGLWFATDPAWRRRYRAQRRALEEGRRARMAETPKISAQTNDRVASGPFAGMKYVPSWGGQHFTHKLLGTYEKEVAHIIEDICHRDYRTVIDIGAAEGYYACGLAFRLPGIRMKAFEIQTELHEVIQRIAKENGTLERLETLGACTVDALRNELDAAESCLIVCDVEGLESELLDPVRVPQLLAADILVEVHDAIRPGVSTAVAQRFQPTHEVEFIEQIPRTLDDLPAHILLDPALALKAMDEGRGEGNDWLWMKRKLGYPDSR